MPGGPRRSETGTPPRAERGDNSGKKGRAGLLILGIDPGLELLGYGAVRVEGRKLRPHAYGVLSTDGGQRPETRLLELYRSLRRLVEDLAPDEAAVERLYFGRNATSAMAVGEARGIVLLTLAEFGIPVHAYAPGEVKAAVTGYGRAPKGQVQEMVRRLLGLTALPRPDDAADALAVAVAHAHRLATRFRAVEGTGR